MKVNFQTGLLIFFGAGLLVAVFIFSGALSSGGNSTTTVEGEVILWGTLPLEQVTPVLEQYNTSNSLISITYAAFSPEVLPGQLVQAFATNTQPDLILFSSESLLSIDEWLFPVPFERYPSGLFTQTFVEAGEVFLSRDGITAFPLLVDPLVMYYNRDIFANGGYATPILFWDELFTRSADIIKKDQTGNIVQALIPFGQFDNVTHAGSILETLLLQSGTRITSQDQTTGQFTSEIDADTAAPLVTFYTTFTDPFSPYYTWNRSFGSSRQAFLAGTLALYPGFASELFSLREQNPNLNYTITKMPQVRDTTRKTTFARVYGIGLSRTPKNGTAAYQVLQTLTSQEYSAAFSNAFSLPSARQDVLALPSGTTFGPVFNTSAVISRAWHNPNQLRTREIWREMIATVLSGRADVPAAVQRSVAALRALF